MTATLRLIQCHPTNLSVTIDGYEREAKTTFDPFDDGFLEAAVIASLTSGDIHAALLAGFIAMADPLTDIATLSSLTSTQKQQLWSSGLCGPYTSSNRKHQVIPFDASGIVVSGVATAAKQDSQTALAGTIRVTTTPDKANNATGPIVVNRVGSTYSDATIRHCRMIPFTSGLMTDATSLSEGPCNSLRTDTDSLIVFGQPPERPLIASQTGSDWTGAAGWSRAGNVWSHAAGGGTGDLEITTSGFNATKVGETYCVVWTLTFNAGTSVTMKLGTGAGAARTASGTYVSLITAATNTKIIFTPTNDADASIDVAGVYVFPGTPPLASNVDEPRALVKIVGCSASSTPTTPHTTAKVWGNWLRRAGAVEVS